MSIIVEMVAYFAILWVVFINLTILYKKKAEGRLPKFLNPILSLAGKLFGLGDALYNVTYGSVLFLELPHKDRLTLTARMKHLILTDDGWRGKLAVFICKYLLEPWDYNHCGLAELKK